MEDVLINYRADVSELAAARRELGLVDNAQDDLVESFRQVNAEARRQTELLAQIAKNAAGGTQAIGDEVRATGKLAQALERINALKNKKLNSNDDKEIAALNKEIQQAEKAFRSLDTAGTEATENIGGGLGKVKTETGFVGKALGQIGPLIAGAFAVDKLVQFATKTIQVTAEFQKFRAILVNTYEGNERAADAALASITAFGAKTPFSVAEITDSFIKLQGSGIVPTTKLLTQLGDVASSKGKSFNDITEAITDAQVFEFERLKEFGIKASQQGDKISFIFKGQKTVVDKTAEAVVNYVRSIGDSVGVAGSMAAISGTLEGQLSNLGDTTDQLFLSIGKLSGGAVNGAISALSSLVQGVTGFINKLGEKDLAQDNSIAQNRNEANTAQFLLDRYNFLTRDGIKPTAEQKAELDRITVQLKDSLGDSVVAIDRETGAFKLNKDAVVAAIKQKLLLANQEAGTLALQANAAKERADQLFAESEAQKKRAQVYLDDLAAQGIYYKQVGNLRTFYDKQGTINPVLSSSNSDALNAQVGVMQKFLGASQDQERAVLATSEALAEYYKKLQALKAIGFDEADITALFNQAIKDQAAAFDENGKASTELAKNLDLLAKAEKAVKDAQDRPAYTEKDLAARNDRVKELQVEVKRLQDLTNAQAPKLTFKVSLDGPSQADFDELDRLVQVDRDKRADEAATARAASIEREAAQYGLYLARNKAAELAELRDALQTGEITRAEFAQRRAALDTKYAVQAQITEVDRLEKLLQNERLSTDERLALQKELQAAQDQLYLDDVDRFTEAQQKKADIERDLRQQAFDAGIQLVNGYFAAQKQSLDDQLTDLQRARDYEITLAGNTAGAKEKIDKAYADKEKKIRLEQAELARKQAIFNKALAIAQIAMNTALGITRVIAEVPKVDFGITTGILIAAYAALGALQAGVVLAQPVAKFAKGTDWVKGGTPGRDSVPALLMPGERVVTTERNREYFTTLSAIHRGEVPAEALAKFVLDFKQYGGAFSPPSVFALPSGSGGSADQEFQRQLLDAIAERPVQKTIIDDQGHRTYLERQGSRYRNLNNRYSFGD